MLHTIGTVGALAEDDVADVPLAHELGEAMASMTGAMETMTDDSIMQKGKALCRATINDCKLGLDILTERAAINSNVPLYSTDNIAIMQYSKPCPMSTGTIPVVESCVSFINFKHGSEQHLGQQVLLDDKERVKFSIPWCFPFFDLQDAKVPALILTHPLKESCGDSSRHIMYVTWAHVGFMLQRLVQSRLVDFVDSVSVELVPTCQLVVTFGEANAI